MARVTYAVTASVEKPTGDIMGGWVTPIESPPTNPAVSPGANVEFKSKHTAIVLDGQPNANFAVNLSFLINRGSRTAAGQPYIFEKTLDRQYLNTNVQCNAQGMWSYTTYLNKTAFMGGIPTQVSSVYVGEAETYFFNASPIQKDTKRKDFRVSFPNGMLP
jgi:hypothetical protein